MLNKHLKINGTSIDLTPSFDDPFEGYGAHNHPLNDIGCSNVVSESFQYVNESLYPIGVVGSTGIQMEIRGGLKNLNRLVIIRTLTFGAHVGIDLGNTLQEEGDKPFIDYVANVIEREKGNQKRIVKMYYIVDTTNLWGEPDGIYLKQVGMTVYSPRYAQTITMMKDRHSTVVDDQQQPETTWGANIHLIHIPENPNSNKSAYVNLGNNLIELKAAKSQGLKPGMHILTHGEASIAGQKSKQQSMYIEPEDYRNNGFYENYKQLLEGIDCKEKSNDILNLLKGGISHVDKEAPTLSILDEVKIGGHSLRTYATTIGETLGAFNKVKDEIKNVAK